MGGAGLAWLAGVALIAFSAAGRNDPATRWSMGLVGGVVMVSAMVLMALAWV